MWMLINTFEKCGWVKVLRLCLKEATDFDSMTKLGKLFQAEHPG